MTVSIRDLLSDGKYSGRIIVGTDLIDCFVSKNINHPVMDISLHANVYMRGHIAILGDHSGIVAAAYLGAGPFGRFVTNVLLVNARFTGIVLDEGTASSLGLPGLLRETDHQIFHALPQVE